MEFSIEEFYPPGTMYRGPRVPIRAGTEGKHMLLWYKKPSA
jgi:hypothetical protein